MAHFQTLQLVVRNLKLADFPAFLEMQGNPNVLRYTDRAVDDHVAARANLEMCIGCYSQPCNNFWVWAIERRTDQAFVGTCAVVGQDHEIGFRFLEKYWGRGYAGEICDALIEHALTTLQLTSVCARAYASNVASVRVLERSQLKFESETFNQIQDCLDRLYRLERE